MALKDFTESLNVISPETSGVLQRNIALVGTLISLVSDKLSEKDFATKVITLAREIETDFERTLVLSDKLFNLINKVKLGGEEVLNQTTVALLALQDGYSNEIAISQKNLARFQADEERRVKVKQVLDREGFTESAKEVFLGILMGNAGKIAVELKQVEPYLPDPITFFENYITNPSQNDLVDHKESGNTLGADFPEEIIDEDKFKQSIIDSGDVDQIFRRLFIARDERVTLPSEELRPNIFPLTVRSHALLEFIIAGKDHQRTTEEISEFLSGRKIIRNQAGVLLKLINELKTTDLAVANKKGIVKAGLRSELSSELNDNKRRHGFKKVYTGEIDNEKLISIFSNGRALTAIEAHQEFLKFRIGTPSSSKIQKQLNELVESNILSRIGGKFENGKAAKYYLKRNVITTDTPIDRPAPSADVREEVQDEEKSSSSDSEFGLMSFTKLIGFTIKDVIPEIEAGRVTVENITLKFQEVGADLNEFLFDQLDDSVPAHQRLLDLFTDPTNKKNPETVSTSNPNSNLIPSVQSSSADVAPVFKSKDFYLEGEVFKTILPEFIPEDFNKDKKNPKAVTVEIGKRRVEIRVDFNNGVISIWEDLKEKTNEINKIKNTLRNKIRHIASLDNIGLVAKAYPPINGLKTQEGKTVYMFENKSKNNIQFYFTVEELSNSIRRITILGVSDHHTKKLLLTSLGKNQGEAYKEIST